MATGKSFAMENLGAEDLEQIAKMQSYRSVEQLEALSPSTGGHTIKDHETLIQELKKENFDLKLRLYMEQKERERVTEEFKQKILILEGDLTEALDELSDALEREKDFEACLENSKRREKALLNKQRRLEESCREQENEIQYLTLSRSRQNLDEIGGTAEASTMTDFPFYRERSVDVGFSDIPLNDTSASPTPTQTDARPQGVDLLNTSGTLLRKKNEIIREAKRRRTAKKKKREMAGSTYDVDVEMEKPEAKKKSFFSKLCCCVKQQSAEYEVDADQNRSRSRNYRR